MQTLLGFGVWRERCRKITSQANYFHCPAVEKTSDKFRWRCATFSPLLLCKLLKQSYYCYCEVVVARIPLSISFSTTFQLSCCYYCNPFNLGKSVRWFISTIRDRGRPDKEQRRAWAFYVLMVRKLKTIELDGCLFIKYLHPKSICRIDSL